MTYNKGTLAYPSSMTAVKPLLVADRSHHGGVPHLLEHVDIRLVLFFSSLLVVEVDARSVEVEVGGDDRLSPIDLEEGVYPFEQFTLIRRL
jgi:hypothetical protein